VATPPPSPAIDLILGESFFLEFEPPCSSVTRFALVESRPKVAKYVDAPVTLLRRPILASYFKESSILGKNHLRNDSQKLPKRKQMSQSNRPVWSPCPQKSRKMFTKREKMPSRIRRDVRSDLIRAVLI